MSRSIAMFKPRAKQEVGKTISKATAAGQIEEKPMSEDWTGLKIANWGLVGHS